MDDFAVIVDMQRSKLEVTAANSFPYRCLNFLAAFIFRIFRKQYDVAHFSLRHTVEDDVGHGMKDYLHVMRIVTGSAKNGIDLLKQFLSRAESGDGCLLPQVGFHLGKLFFCTLEPLFCRSNLIHNRMRLLSRQVRAGLRQIEQIAAAGANAQDVTELPKGFVQTVRHVCPYEWVSNLTAPASTRSLIFLCMPVRRALPDFTSTKRRESTWPRPDSPEKIR
jgi:hypothetical protein